MQLYSRCPCETREYASCADSMYWQQKYELVGSKLEHETLYKVSPTPRIRNCEGKERIP